ncbi:siderophore-interacting protein [Buttiauxella warmboldiae]|uniref:Siderophore-interacting protein n=1 Tax=Buttiauxella warmboldiae TaxID=82993 RepID=A0A3N5DZM9_9ENTR|nr:siderophore-interacting protein [Buttiauxella warmboldiae]RPH31030.1 siderophore-interacting protein [Buttiauxella warmboldiae]
MILQSKPKLPQRVKNEIKFRELIVKSKLTVAGCFHRIVFTSPELAGFSSQGFDDHVKVFFPPEGGEFIRPSVTDDGIVWGEGPRPLSRDYTPLAFDAELNELTLDFYIHAGGVASMWAEKAGVGDALLIGGPRGSLVVPVDYAFQLYVCDESGLPAVRRRLAALPAHIKPIVLVNSHHAQPLDYLQEFAHAQVEWLDADAIASRISTIEFPETDYFIWLTGEGRDVKQLSDELLENRGLDADYVRAVAYWHHK